MPKQPRNLPHLILSNKTEFTKQVNYTYPRGGGGDGKPCPIRDRVAHAERLRIDLDRVFKDLIQKKNNLDLDLATGEAGFYLGVKFPAAEKDEVVQRLENLRSNAKVELMTVNTNVDGEEYMQATLFVPDRQKSIFEKKINEYEEKATKNGKPKNEPLITRIEEFFSADLLSLFTDCVELFPQNPTESMWWEVWLRQDRRASFDETVRKLLLRVQPHSIKFVEREVVVLLASLVELDRVISHCGGAVAELRIAKEWPSLFFQDRDTEQRSWVNELLSRCEVDTSKDVSICLLDTGISQDHPLLKNSLSVDDMHTFDLLSFLWAKVCSSKCY